ncbi:hypothetical protein [Gordonia effusa]|uniref:hypothetical protein n=1 Tax=Gordonia effusa TaxID=263908 RepID=UPI001FDFD07A|nr:hypothetical protein [Gordonia effusa]
MSSDRRAWETRLMRAAASGDLDPNMPVAERAAVQFLLSDTPELDLHTSTVWAELVAADVPAGERVESTQMWMRELRDALRRGHPDQGSGDTT